MLFRKGSRLVKPYKIDGSKEPSTSLSDLFDFDAGFFIDGSAECNVFGRYDVSNPDSVNPIQTPSITVGDFFVNRGLTIVIGEPGSGKSFFVDEVLVPLGFRKRVWGEPESGVANQDFGMLLRHLNELMTTGNRSGVIDSIMPLIITEDSNLGQGGLSKRVLAYLRQLSSIAWDNHSHICLTINPLESGAVLNLWLNYVKAVVHSVVLVEARDYYLGSRILDTKYGVVAPGRELANKAGRVRRLVNNNAQTSFSIVYETLARLDRINSVALEPGIAQKSTGATNPSFNKFPRM